MRGLDVWLEVAAGDCRLLQKQAGSAWQKKQKRTFPRRSATRTAQGSSACVLLAFPPATCRTHDHLRDVPQLQQPLEVLLGGSAWQWSLMWVVERKGRLSCKMCAVWCSKSATVLMAVCVKWTRASTLVTDSMRAVSPSLALLTGKLTHW